MVVQEEGKPPMYKHDDNNKNNNNHKSLQAFVETMPKVELHAHLNGCIRESTLLELAEERNTTLSARHFAAPSSSLNDDDDEDSSMLYNVKPRSLQDCFDMFHEIQLCVNDLVALRRITREALEDFARHHVAYLELRSTPKRLFQKWDNGNGVVATKRDYVETILSEVRAFEMEEEEEKLRHEKELGMSSSSRCRRRRRLPLVVRCIVSVDRSGTLEDAEEHVQLAMDFAKRPDPHVVGVDLGGNPTKNDFRDFEPVFQKARDNGLKVTIHCGEIPCGNECDSDCHATRKAFQEAKSILQFRPDRIGHALLLPLDLHRVLEELRIPVESCPTSNVMTLELATSFHGHLVEGLRRHPRLAYWIEAKYPICISTDDPGVFNTNPSKERLLLGMSHNIGEKELADIELHSVSHAFCDPHLKQLLEEKFKERFRNA